MKCPYRKIIKHEKMGMSSTDTIDIEEFADCYKDDCPFYSPEKRYKKDIVFSEACGRTISNETIEDWLKDLKEGEKNESDHL